MEFTIPPPEGFFFEPALTRQDFAVSPDGERLAFVASNTSKSQLWIGNIGSLRSYPVASGNVRGVVWSPDGRFLYFDERTTVRRVSRDGDAAQTICELPPGPPWMGLLQSGDSLVMYTRAGSYQVPARRDGPPARQCGVSMAADAAGRPPSTS
jgi:Tol biopolymer transport system component